jgi:hypothetical protein
VTLCLRPGSSTRKVVAAAKGQEIPVQRVTSWTAECDRRGRDVDDSVNVIDVDPLPRDSSADIWFVVMVGGNNFDPRARYLANVMRRHLRGEHRTGASNVSVSVRLDMSLSTSGPSPTFARCHEALWASLTDYSGIFPSAASMHGLNAPINACAAMMGERARFPAMRRPLLALAGARPSGITTTGLPDASRVEMRPEQES